MGSKTNYTLIGLSVISLFIGALFIFLWLSVGFNQIKYKTYAVYMNEPVNGLAVKSVVRFNGVAVGSIKKLSLNKQNPKQVLLLINVDETVLISTNTVAILQSQGLTGLSFLELQASNGAFTPLKNTEGEPYPVIPSKPSLLLKLNNILTGVTKNFNQMTESISGVLDDENAKAIKHTLKNIEDFSGLLAKQSKQFTKIINNLDILVKNSAIASKQLPGLIQTVSGSGKAVSQMSNSISNSIPQANALMDDLSSLTLKLNELTKELKQNPSMLIRGRVQRKLGPGE